MSALRPLKQITGHARHISTALFRKSTPAQQNEAPSYEKLRLLNEMREHLDLNETELSKAQDKVADKVDKEVFGEMDDSHVSYVDYQKMQKKFDTRLFEEEAREYGAEKHVLPNKEVVYKIKDDPDSIRMFTQEDYDRAKSQEIEKQRYDRLLEESMRPGGPRREVLDEIAAMGNPAPAPDAPPIDMHLHEDSYVPQLDESDGEDVVEEEEFLSPEAEAQNRRKQKLARIRSPLPEELGKFRRKLFNLFAVGHFDTAYSEFIARVRQPREEAVPKRVYAALINRLIPAVPYILGMPVGRYNFEPGAAELVVRLVSLAAEHQILFSDVEWRQMLRAIAAEATPENQASVRDRLERLLTIFASTEILKGRTMVRAKSTVVARQQFNEKRYITASAPHPRLIVHEAWLAFFAATKNPLAMIAFEHIFAATAFSLGITPELTTSAFRAAIDETQYPASKGLPAYVGHDQYPPELPSAFARAGWESTSHHPSLVHVRRPPVPYMGFLSAPDDVLENPFMFQPPSLHDRCMPRLTMDYRADQQALYPSALMLMRMLTESGSGDREQAEWLFKQLLRVLTNTEKFYYSIYTNHRLIKRYRQSHDYDPDVDFDMAQGLAAPEGEEFRYYAGMEFPSVTSQIAYRSRSTHFIAQMLERLTVLYRHERRPGALNTLLEFMLKQHAKFPLLVPVPSMHVIQHFFDTCFESHDIARARRWLATLVDIAPRLPTIPQDPLMQAALDRVREARENLEEKFQTKTELSTHNFIKERSFSATAPQVEDYMARIQSARLTSLKLEMTAHITYARAAVAAATHDISTLHEIIEKQLPSKNFPGHYRARVFSAIFKRLFHSSRSSRNDHTVGQQLYADYHRALAAAVPGLEARVRQGEKPSADELALVNAASHAFLAEALAATPLTPDVTIATLRPGHILGILHAAQRQGVVVTEQMVANAVGLLCMFPDNMGVSAAHQLFKDMPALGITPTLPLVNRLLEAAAMHAQIKFKFRQHDRVAHGSKPLSADIPTRQARFPLADLLASSDINMRWLSPDSLFALMLEHRLVPNFRSYKYAVLYLSLTRDWQAVRTYALLALDQAYGGSYALAMRLANELGVPLATITNELPFENRLIANDVRQTILMRAGSVFERKLVYQLVLDVEDAEDITLWPHAPEGIFRDVPRLVTADAAAGLAEEDYPLLHAIAQRIRQDEAVGVSRHMRLQNQPDILTKVHNIILLVLPDQNGFDFIRHRKFMELAGVRPSLETFLKAIHVAAKLTVFPSLPLIRKHTHDVVDHVHKQDITRQIRNHHVCDEMGSGSNRTRPMAVLPTSVTCDAGVPVDEDIAQTFMHKRTFSLRDNKHIFDALTPHYDTDALDALVVAAPARARQHLRAVYAPLRHAPDADVDRALRKLPAGVDLLQTQAQALATAKDKDAPTPSKAVAGTTVPSALLQLHESAGGVASVQGSQHLDVVLQEMLLRGVPLIPRVLMHVVEHLNNTHAHAALVAAAYYTPLAALIDAAPLLDGRGRAQHRLSTLTSRERGAIEVEESVLENSLGEHRTTDKLFGKEVVYQHEVVDAGLRLISASVRQAKHLAGLLKQLRTRSAGLSDAEKAVEEVRLQSLLHKSVRASVHVYALIQDHLPPPAAPQGDDAIDLEKLLLLPAARPTYFATTGIKPPRYTNYTDSAVKLVSRAQLRLALDGLASLPQLQQQADGCAVLTGREHMELLALLLRHARYASVGPAAARWAEEANAAAEANGPDAQMRRRSLLASDEATAILNKLSRMSHARTAEAASAALAATARLAAMLADPVAAAVPRASSCAAFLPPLAEVHPQACTSWREYSRQAAAMLQSIRASPDFLAAAARAPVVDYVAEARRAAVEADPHAVLHFSELKPDNIKYALE